MSSPYRIAPVPEPEGPDPVDAYEATLRLRARRTRQLVLALACVGAIAWVSLPLALRSPSHRTAAESAAMLDRIDDRDPNRLETRDSIASARRQALVEQSLFTDAVLLATERDGAPTRETCEVALPETSRLLRDNSAFPLLVVAAGDRHLPSPSVTAFLKDVDRAEAHLASGRLSEAATYARALAAPSRLRQDVVLVTSTMRHPIRNTSSSFEPGEVSGRVFLYDFSQHRVTCVGDIHASSSSQIEYSYAPGPTAPAAQDQGPSLTASLDADLERQLVRAVAHGPLWRTSLPTEH